MKKVATIFAVIVVLAGLAFTIWGKPAKSKLSNSSLSGTYAFSFSGSSGGPIQFSVPGTLKISNPLNNFPPGTPNCPPPARFPCPSVNFANPGPKFSFPIMLPSSVAGQFMADGDGNIPSGSGFVFSQEFKTTDGANYTVEDKSCNFTLTGSFSVLSDGTGTLTITPVGPCISPQIEATGVSFNLLVGARGDSGVAFSAPVPDTGGFATFFAGNFTKQF